MNKAKNNLAALSLVLLASILLTSCSIFQGGDCDCPTFSDNKDQPIDPIYSTDFSALNSTVLNTTETE